MGRIENGEREMVPYKLITEKEGGGIKNRQAGRPLPSLPPPHPATISGVVWSGRRAQYKNAPLGPVAAGRGRIPTKAGPRHSEDVSRGFTNLWVRHPSKEGPECQGSVCTKSEITRKRT